MNLHIAPGRLISDIQKEFNAGFPFLKLEFFTKKALSNSDYSARQLVKTNRRIGDIQRGIAEGNIQLDGELKVQEIEQRLKDEFGLAVQIFRKSGKLWLETTMTDNWTLTQQNNHGKELSTTTVYKPLLEDYDLNRDADH